MAVQLFAHNEKAYCAVAHMLQNAGRAAVIHPTGTGKSFIAFRFVEEHPGARVLWLSPSEYIFKTQLENLCGAQATPANLTFYTYAKLMLLEQQQIETLAPDFIVLDEFHRCGAECWGGGVARLTAAFPHAKLLGLSATSVRYLDNGRDMAMELFEGKIASEMSLGESIVRGILPAPTYINVLYGYQDELEKYQQRVKNLRSPGLQDVNQQYLDALRRALDKAEGMEQIFARHMTPAGKYIVFCSGVEHMREMTAKVPAWFAGVNPDVHTYAVYSDDPETSKSFADFKVDESDALKLLFCINMLNEGVHVKGVAGVVLFRPTVSPIIYKQQIGRALTAGKGGTPTIFDCVCNVDGLCSVDSLQGEIAGAAQRLYANGEGERIQIDHMKIIEQVEDCRALFERLENSLASGWRQYFLAASTYAAEHGDLNIPRKYRTPGGLNLGRWLLLQAEIRDGRQAGVLTEGQIAQLDGIGMVWGNKNEVRWQQNYQKAREYFEQNGNLLVPGNYKTPNGFALGHWLVTLRHQRGGVNPNRALPEARIAQLDAIGMVWDLDDHRWEENYAAAVQYYAAHGDLQIPRTLRTKSGASLGQWLDNMRQDRKNGKQTAYLTPQRIAALDAIGMRWDNDNERRWAQAYAEARAFYEKHGHLRVPGKYVTESGIRLGVWLQAQKRARVNPKTHAKLTPERIALLDGIGIEWETPDSSGGWEYRYQLAAAYLQKHGTATVPTTYKTDNGICLGAWLRRQMKLAGETGATTNLKPLAPWQKEKLEQLGLVPYIAEKIG